MLDTVLVALAYSDLIRLTVAWSDTCYCYSSNLYGFFGGTSGTKYKLTLTESTHASWTKSL
jgi:hypothetical protein